MANTAGIPKVTQVEVDGVAAALRSAGVDPAAATRRQVVNAAGCGDRRARTIRDWLRRAPSNVVPLPPAMNTEDSYKGDLWTAVRVTSERARNEKDVMRLCGADESEWRVKEWECKVYEGFAMPRATGNDEDGWTRNDTIPIIVPLWSIKVRFERKTQIIAIRSEVEELKRRAESYAPTYPRLVFDTKSPTGNLLEISIADHHFGALIWGKETGGADWDLKIAQRVYQDAIASLIARTGHHRFDRVLYVVGHDQQNADNRAGTTERGTPQQNDGRYQKVWWTSRNASVWAVEALCTVAPQVDIVAVEGNHDPVTAFHLGDYLHAWFHNNPNVRVFNGPCTRKVIEHGVVMLMLEHGSNGKLDKYPGTMAADYPEIWGRTKVREAHTADKHHREVKSFIEFPGASVRILPSLRPPCAWASANHFLGALPCAEAYAWNDREGLIGMGAYSVIPESAGRIEAA